MSVIIIDASITLSWYFKDAVSPAHEAILDRVATQGAVVPVHWRLEVANGFRTGLRRQRLNKDYRDASLNDLEALPIEIDAETNRHAWEATLALADLYNLTPYDAAYLELAQRRRMPLATLDGNLARAASDSGVENPLN